MKRNFNLLLGLLLIFSSLKSQEFEIGLASGIGSYNMSQVKQINSEVASGMIFSTKLVSDFPPYFYYRPSFGMKIDDFSLGLVYTFCSTGSRISGKDYSGEYRFDMIVNANSPGLYFRKSWMINSKIDFSLSTIFGGSVSNLTLKEKFVLYDSTLTNDSYKFRATNLFVEPGMNITYSFDHVGIGLNVGYQIQFGAQAFYFGGNENDKLYIKSSGDPIKPDWTGYRIGISLTYKFSL